MKQSESMLGRLLEEISWEGNARHYREGGRGFENVLTAEVFQALNFLPRQRFLGGVIRSLQAGSEAVKNALADEIEAATVTLLPGDIFLAEHPPRGETPLSVQPDGIIESPGVYCLLEAKRIKRGTFQPEQLAREFLTAIQEAGEDRRSLLLLVLPKPPPVSVQGHGRTPVSDAIVKWLPPVLERAEGDFAPLDELETLIDPMVTWTSWEAIDRVVSQELEGFALGDDSCRASVHRLAASDTQAIRWHS